MMKPGQKWTLASMAALIPIIGGIYAFGVWSGTMWVTLNQFNQAVAEVEDRITKLERSDYIDRVNELLDKMSAQGFLNGEERDELCTKAEVLGWEVDGCK